MRFRRALTIVECVIAMTILPLAVAAVAMAVVAGQSQALTAMRQVHVAALAEDLMEEVLSRPYVDPQGTSAAGAEPGENGRDRFDNMDDYHGFTEDAGELERLDGSAYEEAFQRFSRTVACRYVPLTPPLGEPCQGLEITVRVLEQGVEIHALTRVVPEPL